MEIKGCVCVVSGGASGLGEATVRHLLDKGSKVSILDIGEERGQTIASELGDSVIFCKTDVTNEESVQAAINKTMETFGAIHGAINCAGVGTPAKVLGKEGPMPIAQFNQVVQINLVGTMNVIRLAGEHIVKNSPNSDGERGIVVNTASVAAWEGQFGQADDIHRAHQIDLHDLIKSRNGHWPFFAEHFCGRCNPSTINGAMNDAEFFHGPIYGCLDTLLIGHICLAEYHRLTQF